MPGGPRPTGRPHEAVSPFFPKSRRRREEFATSLRLDPTAATPANRRSLLGSASPSRCVSRLRGWAATALQEGGVFNLHDVS